MIIIIITVTVDGINTACTFLGRNQTRLVLCAHNAVEDKPENDEEEEEKKKVKTNCFSVCHNFGEKLEKKTRVLSYCLSLGSDSFGRTLLRRRGVRRSLLLLPTILCTLLRFSNLFHPPPT